MDISKDIEFCVKKSSPLSEGVLKSYADLPQDNYLQENQIFRRRRFSVVRCQNSTIDMKNQTNFFQDNTINHYAGGRERIYEPLESAVRDEFINMYLSCISPIFGNPNCEIGLHQIRITCEDEYVGHPVPEGWHTDGYDYVAIVCVAGSNFCGGTSRIKSDLELDHDLFSRTLKPTEILIFNDRKYFHHTDPINNRRQGEMGYRDILVITMRIL
jgi:hypothetical protein